MDRLVYIYALLDENKVIKYVGKTFNLKSRLLDHWHSKTKSWLAGYIVLELTVESKWSKKERYWISVFGLENLENYTKGGNGSGPRTEEIKRKISETLKGRRSPTKGLKRTKESKLRMSLIN